MARVAVPLASGFEDSEFTQPVQALRDAGHEVVVVGSAPGEVLRGKRGEAHATVDVAPDSMSAAGFDALLIPGGHSPDALRLHPDVVEFVRAFGKTGRPIAAVCHGPQLLIEAELVRGRTLTSWPSVRTDLRNAGAHWVDEEVTIDGNLITSRRPADLPAFTRELLGRLGGSSRGATIGPAGEGTGLSCASG